MLVGSYGPDVEFIDRALEWVSDRLTLDTRRLAITGFSDGASYALSLGITNGDLFTRVNRLLAGVHGTGDPQGQAARLRLPRDARQSAPDRALQSKDRPAARSRGLPGSVPGVRRRQRGPARDRTPSRALVRRIERPRCSQRRVRQTTTILGGEDCDLLFMLLLSNRNENDLEYRVMQQD